jgi:hypothetical protein
VHRSQPHATLNSTVAQRLHNGYIASTHVTALCQSGPSPGGSIGAVPGNEASSVCMITKLSVIKRPSSSTAGSRPLGTVVSKFAYVCL